MLEMTDKQMSEKKKEFRELEVQLYREMKENAKVTGVHDLDELDEKRWQWIEKLVEEVEREQFGKARLIGEPFRKTEEDDEHGSYGTSFEN